MQRFHVVLYESPAGPEARFRCDALGKGEHYFERQGIAHTLGLLFHALHLKAHDTPFRVTIENKFPYSKSPGTPMQGTVLLEGFREEDGGWRGKVLDPLRPNHAIYELGSGPGANAEHYVLAQLWFEAAKHLKTAYLHVECTLSGLPAFPEGVLR